MDASGASASRTAGSRFSSCSPSTSLRPARPLDSVGSALLTLRQTEIDEFESMY